MTQTRETFAGLSSAGVVAWYALTAVSTGIFAWGVLALVAKYRRGRRDSMPAEPIGPRARRAARIVLTHAWIRRRDASSGAAHLLAFYGFFVLLAGTTILAIQDDIVAPLFGVHFWRGWFYLAYSLALDLGGLALVVGLLMLGWKRYVVRPDRLRYRSDMNHYVRGDAVFLGGLLFLAVSGFALEALRIAWDGPSFERWSPVGWTLAQGLAALGLGHSTAGAIRHVTWWLHGLAALTFVASIPYTKAVHMLAGPAAVAARAHGAGQTLVEIPADATPAEVGYGIITDLSPRHLLDLDACTKCGKCHEACPATASGDPLSPRDLILDLREAAEGSLGIRSRIHVEPLLPVTATLVGDVLRPEAVWSCMTCMACVEICPVGIEHVPIINQLRRRMVDEGNVDPKLQQAFETIHQSGNSQGESKRKRGQWARELAPPVKDIRNEAAEYLWFVGDYASFDPRNKVITTALAQLLRRAGIDFGILYDGERNAGNDVRRAGEEGLYSTLADENVKTLARCEFDRILTSDPHSYNAIRNDYPALGGSWEVVHHSELLASLLASGSLGPVTPLGRRATYHDPCHLGRYNGIYDQPRAVMQAVGLELVEMPRNRDNSFCCGAGGGRIWMTEMKTEGTRRPSESRIDEAVALGGIDNFVVACPKDVAMYEDAIKTSGHEGEIVLRELSELVLEATTPA